MEGRIHRKIASYLKKRYEFSNVKIDGFLSIFEHLQDENKILAFNILGFTKRDAEKFLKKYISIVEASNPNYGVFYFNKPCLQLKQEPGTSNSVSYFNEKLGRFFVSNGSNYSVYLRITQKDYDNGLGDLCRYNSEIPVTPPTTNVTYNGQTIPNAWGLGQLDVWGTNIFVPYKVYFVYTEHNSAAPGAFIVGRYGVYPDGTIEKRILEVYNIPPSLVQDMVNLGYLTSSSYMKNNAYVLYLGNK